MKTKIFLVGLFCILLVCGIIVSLRSYTAADPLAGSGEITSTEDPQDALPVWYIGDDRETFGNWYDQVPGDKYGNCAWILGAMNATPIRNELKVPVGQDYRFYDVYGGPLMQPDCGVDYKIYTCKGAAACDQRALLYPDGTLRRAACWFGNAQTINLTIPDTGRYSLSIYVIDWDSTARRQTITVTQGSSSATYDSTSLDGFSGGKYVRFEVDYGECSISITKVAGSNAVVSGIFLDKLTDVPEGLVESLPVDDATKGNWLGVYGVYWYVLSAMAVPTTKANYPSDPSYDVVKDFTVAYALSGIQSYAWTDYCTIASQCNVLEPNAQKNFSFAWSWGPDDGTGKGLNVPPEPWDDYVIYPVPKPNHLLGTAAWASCYDDGGENFPTGPDLYLDLTLPEAGGCSETNCYNVSFYATDYDSICRKQVIEIYDPTTGQLLARTHDPTADPDYGLVGPGVYHTFFMPAGTYLVKIDYYGCTNAILSGIFVDCVECPHGTGDLRTIGFWKHQFSVAAGINKGKAQVNPVTLEQYLAEIRDNTTLTEFKGLDINSAYSILWPAEPADMCTRARQQLLALWLNYASGAVLWTELVYNVVTGTYMQFNLLIVELEDAIVNGDCENAKTIADWLNNSGYE